MAEVIAKKESGLLRSGIVVSVMTLLSRILGMVRDVVIANFFGSSAAADAFFVAFKIPNFLRRLFAEGAFAQAFVPVLSEYRTKRSLAEVKQLVDRTAGTLSFVLTILTMMGIVFAPYIMMLFAPGFKDDPAKMELAGDLLRITFPYLMLISLTAFCGGILNSYGRFAAPAFTPVLLNLCMILSVLFLTPYFDQPVMALGWGVFIAGIVQLVFQMPFLMQLKLLPIPRLARKDEGVKRILMLMLPALFAVSVSQVNLLLDTVLASFLENGSVSWLYYADRLSELPLGAFGIAIGTVILPALSRQHTKDNVEEFASTIDWALRMVLLVGVPAALALGILAEPLLATLYHYGKMSDADVHQAAMALQAYSLGVLTFMLIKVLAPGYFARQDLKTPVKIAVFCMLANMVFNLILIWHWKHVGLAFATSLSSVFNAGLLLLGLHRAGVYRAQKGWLKFFLQLLVGCGLMVAFVLWYNQPTELWLRWTWDKRAWEVAILVVGGIFCFLVGLAITGVRLRHLRR